MSEPSIDRLSQKNLPAPSPAGSAMRRAFPRRCCGVVLLSMVVSPFAFAGCGGGPADKLEGKWVGERIDNVSAEQVARATAWVKATTLEFAGDKLTVTIPTETARKGTFKVAKVDGDKLVLSVHRKDSATRDETTFTLQGDKTLHWDIGQSREITLVRAQ
ncbi:MAG TPA: hypothetical protein VK550_22910 [Polyangiaceae bacterium]|nr:hypothetical protein [Polyangiaceae bacterium]